MNPRDYTTWTTFADHPIFGDQTRPPSEWSSDSKLYEDLRWTAFDPEWYVHCDPKLPTDVQAAVAERDMRNLRTTCADLTRHFGPFDHELFILDDLTVFVRITSEQFTLELYPSDYGDGDDIMSVYVEEPTEDEFLVDSIEEIVPRLEQLLNQQ